MKNYDIYNADATLGAFLNEPLKGALKFKLFKAKSELEGAVAVIIKTLEGVEGEEERNEILQQEQEVKVPKFTTLELEPLALSMRQIASLASLIDFEEEE